MLDCISWLQARNLNCEECWVLHRTLKEMELSKGSTWSTSQTLFQTRKQILKLEKLDVFDPSPEIFCQDRPHHFWILFILAEYSPRVRFWPAVSDNYFVVLWRERRDEWETEGRRKRDHLMPHKDIGKHEYWLRDITHQCSTFTREKTKSNFDIDKPSSLKNRF